MVNDIAQLITAIAAIAAVVASLRNSRKIGEVHLLVNSRLDQLLKASGEAQKAEGVAQERARRTDETGRGV